MTTTEELFTVSNVSKEFGENVAVRPLSFVVRPGESLGLIGESGSGKTTLTRMMLGLLEPTSGETLYRGEPVRAGKLGMTRLRREVQLVLQDPFASLNPRMTIGQIISEPLRLRGTRRTRDHVQEALAAVDLNPDWHGRYPHELSGGQRQRVAIARAVAARPQVIIADEPVSALDVSVRVKILELLERLSQEYDLTYILISHDLGVVQRICSSTLVLFNGEMVEHRPTHELLTKPQHPATIELLQAVPHLPEGAA